jgi:hypothetical protein
MAGLGILAKANKRIVLIGKKSKHRHCEALSNHPEDGHE